MCDKTFSAACVILYKYPLTILSESKMIDPIEPLGVPAPATDPEINPIRVPEDPPMPAEQPDIIPNEEPVINPPQEVPDPGEGQ